MKKEAKAFLAVFVVVLFALSPVLSAIASSSPSGGDWKQFVNNVDNTRYQPTSLITSTNVGSLAPTWSFSTQNSVTSTPVVYKGVAYFDDWSGYVYAVNVFTGALIWEVHPGEIFTSTPSISNGVVYVAGYNGGALPVVFALSPADGHTIWTSYLPSSIPAIYGSPIYYNNMLYIGTGGCPGQGTNSSCRGEVFALNANTGAVVWDFVTGGSDGGASVWGSIMIDPKLNAVFFGTGYNYLISNPETYPTIVGGTVTSLGTFGFAYSVISLNAATGAFNWYYQAYKNKTSAGDVDFGSTGNLYAVTIHGARHNVIGIPAKDGYYYVIDRSTGVLLERILVGYPATQGGGVIGLAGFTTNPPDAPQVFVPAYYGANTTRGCCGIASEITPANGKVDWSFNTPGKIIGSVAIVPGAVIFGDYYGNLYALSTSTGAQLYHYVLNATIDGGVTEAENRILVPTSFGPSGTSGVTAFDVLPTPSILATASPSMITLDGEAAATATLGGGSSPSGTVTFTAYDNSSCSASSAVYTSTPVSVSGDGVYSSGTFSPLGTGTIYWTVTYSGDTGNNPASSGCGAAGSLQTVTSIPAITGFGYKNTPTLGDPSQGAGTVDFTLSVTNYGAAAVTLGGSVSVTSAGELSCTGGNSLGLAGSVAAGATQTFTLGCTYSGSTGQTVDASATVTFTDLNGAKGTVAGSPTMEVDTLQT